MGKSFHRQKSVSISAEKFQKALENCRYKNIKPDMILENYFGRPLLSRQEEGLLKEQKRQEIIRRVTNVEAVKKDGTIHMGMDGFQKEKDMLQVPLGVISDWKEVRCLQQKIYIVENPSVFAMLCGMHEWSASTRRTYAP